MKKLLLIFILLLVSITFATNLSSYIVDGADGYFFMHSNSDNFALLEKIPFMNFLLNRMGLGMMLQLNLSKAGMNADLLNSVFGNNNVDIVYQQDKGYMCAFVNADITPKYFIEKFTPNSTKVINERDYSYIKNGEDYIVFFNSGIFSYMSKISPEKYVKLLKSNGTFKYKDQTSDWISMELNLNPDEIKDVPFDLPKEDITAKNVKLRGSMNIKDNKLIAYFYTDTDMDPQIKKIIEDSSNDKKWFSSVKYFGSGLYAITAIDNINSIFDYIESNANSTDKKLINNFKTYVDYFTGRVYFYFPLSIGSLLSSDETNNDYILSLQYTNSDLISQLNNNKSLQKSTTNGITYYETTDSGSKTYIYLDNNFLDLSSMKPADFIKTTSASRTPVTVKSFSLLEKYIKSGVISFYWDVGEDLEKSMYLKAPFDESGVVMNLDYRNGELQLTLVIH